MRGSKIGDSVWVEPMRDKRLHGVIVGIDSQHVRCVATDEGFHYAAPGELHASDQPASAKAVEDLEPGDTVVLFNGVRRTVEALVPTGTPTRYRVLFAEQDKPLTIFREQVSTPGTLWRLVHDR